MTYEEIENMEQEIVACPNCGSHNILVLDEDELICNDCQTTFSLSGSPDGLRDTAMLYYEKAQKDLALHPMSYHSIRSDLHNARRLLERDLKNNRKDPDLFLQLTMVYLSLGDTWMIDVDNRDAGKGLEAYRKALRYIKKSRESRDDRQTYFLQGTIHDKMAAALNDFKQPESVITQQKKAVKCFETYLNEEDPEKISKANDRISRRFMARNLWMLAQMYFQKDEISQGLEMDQKLLETLDAILLEDPESERAVKAGMGMIHQQMAEFLDLLPDQPEKKLLQENRAFHLQQSQKLSESLSQSGSLDQAQADFMIWLGLLDPRKKEDYLKAGQASQSYENDEPIDWQSMTKAEQDETMQHLNNQFDFLTQALIATVHSDKEAIKAARQLIEAMEQSHQDPTGGLDTAQMCFYLAEAGDKFKEAGYNRAAFDLWKKAIFYGDQTLESDLEKKYRNMMENFLAGLCFEGAGLAITLQEEEEVVTSLLHKSYEILEKLDQKQAVESRELYGTVLITEAGRLLTIGETEKSKELEAKANQVLDLDGQEVHVTLDKNHK